MINREEYHLRYKKCLMAAARVDASFADSYMSQRKHVFNYNYLPEFQALSEIICWPGVVIFFS